MKKRTIIIIVILFSIFFISILVIRNLEIENKKRFRENKFDSNKVYHPKFSIYAKCNYSQIENCISDENLGSSYAVLWKYQTYNFSFQTSNTGIFLMYYIIRCNGNFLINNSLIIGKKDFSKNYDLIPFLVNKTNVNILIKALNHSVEIAELFGLDMNWINEKPKLIRVNNKYTHLINWNKFEKWLKSVFNQFNNSFWPIKNVFNKRKI